MCETCNPLCGQCKAAKYKVVLCPSCGKATMLSREACLFALGRPHRMSDYERKLIESGEIGAAVCRSCGADLLPTLEEALRPLACTYSGIVCGYPCGRRTERRGERDEPCATQVPLARL